MTARAGIHPDEVETASWLEGRLPPDRREAFEAHLAGCDLCRTGVRLLRQAEAPAPVATEGSDPRRGNRPPDAVMRAALAGRGRAPRRGLAAAATLVAAAGLAIWWGVAAGRRGGDAIAPPAGEAPPVFRDAEGETMKGLTPFPGASVRARDVIFSWAPVPGAERYQIVVMDRDGTEVLRADAPGDATQLAWPETAEPPSGALIWSVRAMTLDRVLAESRPAPFDVR